MGGAKILYTIEFKLVLQLTHNTGWKCIGPLRHEIFSINIL